jgi:cysteine desulfurase
MKKRGSRALLHTDAVQGFLKVPFRANRLGADLISISGHKIHAPKGIGALYIRRGLRLAPYLVGGGQERGPPGGTEAMPQIAAFAAAGQRRRTPVKGELGADGSAAGEVRRAHPRGDPGRCAPPLRRAPYHESLAAGYKSEVLMNFLEAREILCLKSSACKKGARSHVLEAIGLKNEVIDGALRISFSRYTTPAEIDALCDALRTPTTSPLQFFAELLV